MRRALLAAVLAAVLFPVPARASYEAPCIPGKTSGPTCIWWKAKATFVADGDTIDARIKGVGKEQVRFSGINAMELSRYSRTASKRRGSCHSLEAAANVDRVFRAAHRRILLAAQDPASRSGRRIRRSVWVKQGGKLVDVARLQIEAGLALWMPNTDEWVHNADYARLAAGNLDGRKVLFDPDACGAGPDPAAQPSVSINWDADGNDEHNQNGEWATIYNLGAQPLSLKGWWFRDSALRWTPKKRVPGYPFKPSVVVPPYGFIRLHAGCGTDTLDDLFWCAGETVWENVDERKSAGDGGYLFDPDGDLRAGSMYPCLVACANPLRGRAAVIVHPRRPESIRIQNVTASVFDLGLHIVKLRNKGRAGTYVFGVPVPLGWLIEPTRTFGLPLPKPDSLADKGGVVELRTMTDQLASCTAWGFGSCPPGTTTQPVPEITPVPTATPTPPYTIPTPTPPYTIPTPPYSIPTP